MCAAALALAASGAAAQDGPVKFYGPNDPIPPGAVVPVPLNADQSPPPPTWVRRVRPEFPAAASQAGVTSGEVTLNCLMTDAGALTECQVNSERPAGLGFGDAALHATGAALMRPPSVDGRLLTGRINFTVRFDNSYSAPQWRRSPEPEFPEAADKAGILEGRATVQCAASIAGALSECEVLDETPAGYGFGKAVAVAAAEAIVHPQMIDGQPTAGEIRFSVGFRIDPKTPAAQSAPSP